MGGFIRNIPVVTRNLILINIILFVATLINEEFMLGTFALYSPWSPYFRWWQVVTHMFMHGGFWHIFFNMYSLLLFGSVVERTIGRNRYLILYFVTGFGAVLLHLGVQYLQCLAFASINGVSVADVASSIPPTVGASGALYGVLVAYGMLYPHSRLTLLFPPVTLEAKWFVIIFAAIELFTGVVGVMDGIAHFAHLGGMLFGFLLIRYWQKGGRSRRRDDDYENTYYRG